MPAAAGLYNRCWLNPSALCYSLVIKAECTQGSDGMVGMSLATLLRSSAEDRYSISPVIQKGGVMPQPSPCRVGDHVRTIRPLDVLPTGSHGVVKHVFISVDQIDVQFDGLSKLRIVHPTNLIREINPSSKTSSANQNE